MNYLGRAIIAALIIALFYACMGFDYIKIGQLTPLETLVNAERTEPLQHSILLEQFAQERCEHLQATNTFDHQGFKEPLENHFNFFNRYAENLARDFSSDEATVQGWLASPAHRDTLKDSQYKYVGTAKCGKITVQLFAN